MIKASIDVDKITNNCNGLGRVQIRLGPAEDIDTVKLNYVKQGYNVSEHKDVTKKATNFTQQQTLSVKSPGKNDIEHRNAKQGNLMSSGGPGMYGSSS